MTFFYTFFFISCSFFSDRTYALKDENSNVPVVAGRAVVTKRKRISRRLLLFLTFVEKMNKCFVVDDRVKNMLEVLFRTS